MHRLSLQAIAEEKLGDARLLAEHGRSSGAYYLAGYAVELGLKACIAKQFKADVIPDKRFVQSIYDHNFANLVRLAGLADDLQARQILDRDFAASWNIVLGWTPDSRYRTIDQDNAVLLVAAIADEPYGVLPWIRTAW